MANRSLTIRIRIDDRVESQEVAIIAKVREQLAKLPGDPRPTLEIANASTEAVAVEAEP